MPENWRKILEVRNRVFRICQSGSADVLFPGPFVKTAGNRRAEKCVPPVNLPNRGAHNFSGGLFDQIAHRTGFDRFYDIRFITVS